MTDNNTPLWRSHGEILAAQIFQIEFLDDGGAKLYVGNPFPPIFVSQAWAVSHLQSKRTSPGHHINHGDCGFFVKYKNGYTSWSPTAAFEDGYTEIFADGTDAQKEASIMPDDQTFVVSVGEARPQKTFATFVVDRGAFSSMTPSEVFERYLAPAVKEAWNHHCAGLKATRT